LPARDVPDGEDGHEPSGVIYLVVEMVAAAGHQHLADAHTFAPAVETPRLRRGGELRYRSLELDCNERRSRGTVLGLPHVDGGDLSAGLR
jgi:hypothetical protein